MIIGYWSFTRSLHKRICRLEELTSTAGVRYEKLEREISETRKKPEKGKYYKWYFFPGVYYIIERKYNTLWYVYIENTTITGDPYAEGIKRPIFNVVRSTFTDDELETFEEISESDFFQVPVQAYSDFLETYTKNNEEQTMAQEENIITLLNNCKDAVSNKKDEKEE